VERKLESKIRRRFDQLYDDLVAEDYNEDDVQELLDRHEEEIIDELDEFAQEDDE
jgi:hypothetical protein